jgi:hypothetical protein
MNWFDQAMSDIGNAVEDAVEWVGDAVEAVGEAIVAGAEAVGEMVVDAVETVVDWTLTVADTVIFDPVDFITGGVIDVDYEDGQLTGELNLGIASVGISVGEQGFDAHAGFDIGIASGEISYDSDDGLAISGSLGVDWGPLPYAEGHMDIGVNGEISIGGQIQGTLPLPFGSIGGEVSGELYRSADGTWGATSTVDVLLDGPGDTGASLHNDASIALGREGFEASTTTDIRLDGPAGTGAEFHNDASIALGREGFEASTATDVLLDGPLGTGAELHNDASIDLDAGSDVLFDAGVEAAATGLGGKGIGTDANVGYSNITDADGNITTTAQAGAGVSIGDRAIDASTEFVGTRSDDGERSSSVSGDVDVTGYDLPSLAADRPGGGTSATDSAALVEAPLEPSAAPLDNPSADSISQLAGTGDLSDAFATGDAEVHVAVELVESGALDDFSSDIVSSEIAEAAVEQVWDDIGQ